MKSLELLNKVRVLKLYKQLRTSGMGAKQALSFSKWIYGLKELF